MIELTDLAYKEFTSLQPGASMSYYIGDLSFDRRGNKTLSSIAKWIYGQMEAGRCHLVQRRIGKSCFEYIAQRTSKE